MTSPSVLLQGAGWRLPCPLDLRAPLTIQAVPAGRPELLDGLLEALDSIAESGDPHLLAAGFITYEAGLALEGSVSLLRPSSTPLAWFAIFNLARTPGGRDAPGIPGPEAVSSAALPGSQAAGRGRSLPGPADLGPERWSEAVSTIREGIARGEVYQVNLTRRIVRSLVVPPRRLADLLLADNPVPYPICLEAGPSSVVSNSPELFLDLDLATGQVSSSPIKGTIPRKLAGRPGTESEALLASEKDAAEHLMIVDLVRNDLGKVCQPGSVHVPVLRGIKTLRHLHHIESTISGRLRRETRLSDVLRATMPPGSVTGAPKRAALGFIRRLEPVPRGPYTGICGYVRGDGSAVFNVAIRTAVQVPGELAYHTGGGIVWDSSAEAEWEETRTKSLEFHRALAELSLAGTG